MSDDELDDLDAPLELPEDAAQAALMLAREVRGFRKELRRTQQDGARTKRITFWLVISLAAHIPLTLGLGALTLYSLNQSNENRQVQIAECQDSNVTRSELVSALDFLLAKAVGPPSTETASTKAFVASLESEIASKFSPRNCSNLSA